MAYSNNEIKKRRIIMKRVCWTHHQIWNNPKDTITHTVFYCLWNNQAVPVYVASERAQLVKFLRVSIAHDRTIPMNNIYFSKIFYVVAYRTEVRCTVKPATHLTHGAEHGHSCKFPFYKRNRSNYVYMYTLKVMRVHNLIRTISLKNINLKRKKLS